MLKEEDLKIELCEKIIRKENFTGKYQNIEKE